MTVEIATGSKGRATWRTGRAPWHFAVAAALGAWGCGGGRAVSGAGQLAGAPGPILDSLRVEEADALAGVPVETAAHDTLRDALPSDTARVPVNEADVHAELSRMFGPEGVREAEAAEVEWDIPIEMNEQVARWLAYFRTDGRENFELWLARSGRYEKMLREELRALGLPEDLVYLSLIESGFSPRAYSRAHAVGLWQFIASTARIYDLEINYWVDQRRDPVAATRAAARHLRDLHDRFGTWYLAAAAYNAGAARVQRSIRRTGSDNFWDLAETRYLRRETRNYVPKLIAAALIAKQPERYGFVDIEYFEPMTFDEVEVPDATSLDVVAEAAGATFADVQALNPHVLRGVTPPDRPFTLRIPRGMRDTFSVRYAQVPAGERVTWLTHVVRRGQTLGVISSRYGVSVQAILAANPGTHPRRLRIGQTLVIPKAGGIPAASLASAAVSRPAPRDVTWHRVRRGDTLWDLSRRYGVSIAELMEWNGLTGRTIRSGQRLRVRPPVTETEEGRVITHRVQRGDTLWAIAQRYSVSAQDLMRWNNLGPEDVIRPGDEVRIVLR
ncbi:MAG: LysM peptidoglycan-binding domain-containing protein [Gemmatimonadota bacterium]